MDEAQFWLLVGSDGSLERLGRDLRSLADPDQVLAFHERLSSAVGALGTAAHREVEAFWDHDGGPVDHSDDEFLNLRLTVVSCGEAVWRGVVEQPDRLRGPWPWDRGEELEGVIHEAFEDLTDDPWPLLGLAEEPPDESIPPLRLHTWLGVHAWALASPRPGNSGRHLRDVEGWLSPEYTAQIRFDSGLIGEDPAWMTWWNSVRGQASQVNLTLSLDPRGTRRRRIHVGKDYAGREDISYTAVLPAPPDKGQATAAQYRQAARDDLVMLLGHLFDKLGIPHPDPLLPDMAATKQLRAKAAAVEAAERREYKEWDRLRKSVARMWVGRVPDAVVRDLTDVIACGFRRHVPGEVARMRTYFGIEPTDDDAEVFRAAGYTEAEIATALHLPPEPEPADRSEEADGDH